MALPKRRLSHSRQGSRTAHTALKPPVLMECPQCHGVKLQHQTCPICGTYNGRTVVDVAARAKKKKEAEKK